MPSKIYKESRVCECGYTTKFPSAWFVHKKSCKLVITSDKERIASLEQQLVIKDEQMKEQLAAKDRQLAEQRDEIERLIADRFYELKEENKELRKRKKPRSRIYRSEPERRKIAQRQDWKCAGETCELAGDLEAYDLDHIIPLWKGGDDTNENLQALCPACHRKKTDLERETQVKSG